MRIILTMTLATCLGACSLSSNNSKISNLPKDAPLAEPTQVFTYFKGKSSQEKHKCYMKFSYLKDKLIGSELPHQVHLTSWNPSDREIDRGQIYFGDQNCEKGFKKCIFKSADGKVETEIKSKTSKDKRKVEFIVRKATSHLTNSFKHKTSMSFELSASDKLAYNKGLVFNQAQRIDKVKYNSKGYLSFDCTELVEIPEGESEIQRIQTEQKVKLF